MKLFLYVCGPSCSGKSCFAKELITLFPTMCHVKGDDYWARFGGLSFGEHVQHTASDLLDAVDHCDQTSILCEWVPWLGAFPEELKQVAGSKGYRYYQIVLHAPIPVLLERKQRRDGNFDLGCDSFVDAAVVRASTPYVYDTSVCASRTLAEEFGEAAGIKDIFIQESEQIE
jgi:hypothetical protein